MTTISPTWSRARTSRARSSKKLGLGKRPRGEGGENAAVGKLSYLFRPKHLGTRALSFLTVYQWVPRSICNTKLKVIACLVVIIRQPFGLLVDLYKMRISFREIPISGCY